MSSTPDHEGLRPHLPYSTTKRIIKTEGVERIGEEAVHDMRIKAEEYLKDLARESRKIADNSGRVTVKPEDVDTALDLR